MTRGEVIGAAAIGTLACDHRDRLRGGGAGQVRAASERLQAVIDFTFGGSHHVRGLTKEVSKDVHILKGGMGMWTFRVNDGISTFDGSYLTRLVIAAHDHCVRASICQSGPRMLKVVLHARFGREGSFSERHPSLEEAIQDIRGNIKS